MAFGPVPRIGELRSRYLLRVSLVSAFWFVVLTAIFRLALLIARRNDVDLGSDDRAILLFFYLGCFVAMSIVSMVGSFAWSIGVRLFNRDSRYFENHAEQSDDD